jgi:hypothetical protein
MDFDLTGVILMMFLPKNLHVEPLYSSRVSNNAQHQEKDQSAGLPSSFAPVLMLCMFLAEQCIYFFLVQAGQLQMLDDFDEGESNGEEKYSDAKPDHFF